MTLEQGDKKAEEIEKTPLPIINFVKGLNYSIEIKSVVNGGFKVKVGCAELYYKTQQELIVDLNKFLSAPKQVEKEYNTVTTLKRETVAGSPYTIAPILNGLRA